MFSNTVSVGRALAVGGVILAVQGVVLYLFGQPTMCECGYVKLWEGVVHSVGNSQHFFDWYTPSHVIHGLIFYAALWYFFPKMPLWWRLALAIGIESAWEIAENTPMVINHYRQQALAAGYTGDSILNSLMDTLAMVGGFLLARRIPVWAAVAVALALELFVGYMIRDNLTLNVLGMFYVFPWVTEWQSGG
ncbi:DUF2585 family protein [Candidatus Kaiserbacteria bacterium]|nr:DUF2585 family protein [Candidatus Kaiserbacteria bacterium]